MKFAYQFDTATVLEQLEVDIAGGLDATTVDRRLAAIGYNELAQKNFDSPWTILLRQLMATMVVILMVAAVVSGLLGDVREAIAIFAIVIFNAALGFKQEYQAERAIAALKRLAVPTVRVRREGQIVEISARELVPGDIVLLEAGNVVPADCRLLESVNLRTSEASLTGESEPIDKHARAIDTASLPIGDRRNMAFMGTVVTYGRGTAVVTATGMATELGRIASAIQTTQRELTPLQLRLEKLGQGLAIAILAIVAVIFSLGLGRGESISDMFLTAVSLAVAAVPEGLPAVVTIALALGAQRMLERHALIRKLPAVETLGSVDVICSDKTGTLTENRMVVTSLSTPKRRLDVSDRIMPAERPIAPQTCSTLQDTPDIALLLTGASACNDGRLEPAAAPSESAREVGDPTETALIVAAACWGLHKSDIETIFPRIAEIPFDSDRKRMTTVHKLPAADASLPAALGELEPWRAHVQDYRGIAFVKGAVDRMVDVCDRAWVEGQWVRLDEALRQRIRDDSERLAGEGIRVLGLAFRPLAEIPTAIDADTLEQHLVFMGTMGTVDPARPEAEAAIQLCRSAGIRPLMITGDHPLTALHIARELGLTQGDRTLTGTELDRLSASELDNAVEQVAVYTRVSPQNKLDIVRALQNRGHVVAMTGDGVNDAPALKQAHIGVAMGITGTDVAKEAADMVLLDDNFATIVAATREGRVIYDNIRKFIKFTLTGNSGELWAIAVAPLLGMPLPLLPLQILWINLLGDGILAIALSVEPGERAVMHRPPYRASESIFGRGVGRTIFWVGLQLGLLLLAIAYAYWSRDRAEWQTMVFATLAFSRIALVQTMRSDSDSFFRLNPRANLPLLGAVVLTLALQLAVLYVPALQQIFTTMPLDLEHVGLCLALSTVPFWAIEGEKGLRHWHHRSERSRTTH